MKTGARAALLGGTLIGILALGGCAAWWPATGDLSSSLAGARAGATKDAPQAGATPTSTEANRVATVQAHSTEQFSGRLSLRVHQPSTGATDGGTLLFEFEGTPQEGVLVLNTVIGTAVANARWNPQGAEIVTPRGRQTGQSLDEVATALLGQALPLAAILQWVRAEPWPLAPHERNAEGFDQLGWSVSLQSWHERVVTARKHAQPDRRLDLDITVRARLDEPSAGERRTPL